MKPAIDANTFRGKRGPARSSHRQLADRLGMTRAHMYEMLALASLDAETFEHLMRLHALGEVSRAGVLNCARGRQRPPPITPGERLRRAWNAAGDDARIRFVREIFDTQTCTERRRPTR